MRNVIKNTFKIFTRDKDFFSSIIIEPVAMLLIFSFFLAFQNSVPIAVVNNDEGELGTEIVEMLDDMDYLKILKVDESNIEKELAADSIKLGIVIGSGASEDIKSGKEADIRIITDKNNDNIVKYLNALICLKTASFAEGSEEANVELNALRDTGIPINNSLGVLVFKIIGTGSMLGALLIKDRKRGIADRIKVSGLSIGKYLGGTGFVFLICSMVSSVTYFIFANIFNFSFGIEHKVDFLIIMLSVNFLAMCLSLFISSLVKDDGILWNINVMVILPTSILSGAFFDFNSMPPLLRAIGSIFPQRWVSRAVEILQNGGTMYDAFYCIIGILVFSLVLLMAAVYITNLRLSGRLKEA